MRSQLLFGFFAFAISLISSGSVAQSKSSQTIIDKYVEIDGKKMHYQAAGSGSATVVFESGHYDDMTSWNTVFTSVAKFAKVVRYDRPGYGSSELATIPKSQTEIAKKLHDLLQKEDIKPPYILVGHSLGGTLIRAFASLYKTEVSGFVFIDPANEYALSGMSDEFKKLAMAQMEADLKNAPAMAKAEGDIMKGELLSGFPEMNAFGPLPNVPTIIMAAGKGRPPGWQKSVTDLFDLKMKDLSEVRLYVLPRNGHYIQREDPVIVLEAIRRVVFPDAENILRKVLNEKGVDACISQYKAMKQIYPEEYMLERHLNVLGYDLLRKDSPQEAVRIFALNAEMYPSSSNVYDSLGEAYLKSGNKEEAIKNYKISLSMNPKNNNAAKVLESLK